MCLKKNCFHPHGVLLDCTCGNIITVKHFQHWLRRLCLKDYNTAIIYVKDIFQLPDEEKTYELIRKMLTSWRNAFSSGRIHLAFFLNSSIYSDLCVEDIRNTRVFFCFRFSDWRIRRTTDHHRAAEFLRFALSGDTAFTLKYA